MMDLMGDCKFGTVSTGRKYGLKAPREKARKIRGFCTVSPYPPYIYKIRQIRQACRWWGETSALSPSTVQLHLGADTGEMRCRYGNAAPC
jgi:hypothetical protein